MSDDASPAQTAATGERERILVCDDDPRVRDTIVEAMAAEGMDVDSADRAVDAISASCTPPTGADPDLKPRAGRP
jgi:CheY-like chemotaxis protein